MKKKYKDIKKEDKIQVFGDVLTIKKIDFSEKGIKQGRVKCRIEAIDEAGEEKIIIRLADEYVEVF